MKSKWWDIFVILGFIFVVMFLLYGSTNKARPTEERIGIKQMRCDGFDSDKERREYDRLRIYHGAMVTRSNADGSEPEFWSEKDRAWHKFVWPANYKQPPTEAKTR